MNTHEAETVAEYMIDTFYLDFIQEDYELFLNKFKNFDAKNNVAISSDSASHYFLIFGIQGLGHGYFYPPLRS